MSKAVAKKKSFDESQIEIIRRTIAPGLTDDELQVFLHVCDHTGLDPFCKQIYAIKRGDRMTIQTSIDGLRLIAERTGRYSPGRETHYHYDPNGALLGATSYIKKMTPDGTWHELSASALLKEYSTKRNLWLTMPHVMIEKCAEARALRRGFPDVMGGLLSEEEMMQADVAQVESKTKQKELPVPVEYASEKSIADLLAYLGDNEELKSELLRLCEIDTFAKLTIKQLDACRIYVRQYNSRQEDKNENVPGI